MQQFEAEKDEIKKVYTDDIQSAQAQCLAIRVLCECQCNSCGQDFRPGQVQELHTDSRVEG